MHKTVGLSTNRFPTIQWEGDLQIFSPLSSGEKIIIKPFYLVPLLFNSKNWDFTCQGEPLGGKGLL